MDWENSDQNDLYCDMLKLPEQPAEGTAPVDLTTQICYGGNKYLLHSGPSVSSGRLMVSGPVAKSTYA